MRKTLAFLALLVALTLSPLWSMAAEYSVPGLYTVRYDDALTLDDRSFVGDNTSTYTWLFLLFTDEYEIDADLTKMEAYEGFSLYSATEAERARYLADTLDSLADYQGTLVTTLDVASGGGSIPFYIYGCRDEDGAYYLAETIAQGYAISFYCYYVDADAPLDDALLDRLRALVSSFTPIGG